MSHYSALFKYRPRPDRIPLEDFLTCALTDVLNRLTQDAQHALVKNLLLDENARSKWSELGDRRCLTWSAHRSLPDPSDQPNAGYCDILLKDQEGPLLIIENKIAAGFTHSRHASASNDDTLEGHQLVRYGKWLAAQCEGRRWPGALVLLSHFTSPPDDFSSGPSHRATYGVSFTHTCRWSQIVSWLRQFREDSTSSESQLAKFLAEELAYFLEEMNMNAEALTQGDLKSAESFVCSGSVEKIVGSFETIRSRLQSDLKELIGTERSLNSSRNLFSIEGLILDWVDFKEEDLKGWRTEWGLCWPCSEWTKQLQSDRTQIPNGVFWYVAVYCAESKKLCKAKALLESVDVGSWPKSWQRWGLQSQFDCGLFVARAASDFSGDGSIEQVAKWMGDELKSLSKSKWAKARRKN